MKRRSNAKKKTKQKKEKAEISELGQAIRKLGTVAGSLAGGIIGAPTAGGVVGNSLAGALSRWLGAGDYSVGTNSIVQKSLKAASSIPYMHTDNQTVTVRHKEYLGEVYSSIPFGVQQSFPLNPGMALTFPWLAGVAVRFQEYRIKGLVFHYIPSSGSAVSSGNAALGTVMIQTSYRSTDSPPASKVEMLNEYCSNECVPSETLAHPIECDPKENPFNVQYVRSGSVPTGESQLNYDLGVTHVAVSGSQTNGNALGDLWVTYEIELKKPLVTSNVTHTVTSTRARVTSGITPTSVFSPTASTTPAPLVCTLLGNTITIPAGNVGRYLVTVLIGGNTLSLAAPFGGMTFAGCSNYNWNGLTYYTSLTGTSLVQIIFPIEITNPAATPVITLSVSGTATTMSSTDLMITEI